MILSSKGRYGLKAVFDIALNSKGRPVSIKEISERNDISILYLEQIFAILKKNSIVKSVRGAQGGYLLQRDPSEITVGDVIRGLEGELSPSACVVDNSCDNSKLCPTFSVWSKIKDSIDSVIDTTSIQDMLDEYYENRKVNIK